MNLHLILHDIGYVVDAVLSLFVIVLVFMKVEKKSVKITLMLTWLLVIVFVLSHAIGVSVNDSNLSRMILMFNLVNIFIPIFTSHCVFAFLNKEKEQKVAIITSYIIGTILLVFFLFNPKLFLLNSVPKMYFPNYYVAGPYYWVVLVFFATLIIYFLFQMLRSYRVSFGLERNRISYFFVAWLIGYAVGSIDFFLVYNIPVDPLWGILCVPACAGIFTYAVIKYNLLDINFVAKKAFVYALITAILGGVISLSNYTSIFLVDYLPNWIFSLILAFFATGAVYFIWNKSRESDVLKYEFINVVTHKFRTPLTSIKWISENLKETVPNNIKEDIEHIRSANDSLIELTNLLVNLSGTDDKSYEYIFEKLNITSIVDDCLIEVNEKSKMKDITLSHITQPELYINGDLQKIKFVIQTLLNNAVNYTPKNGKVIIELSKITSQFSKNKLVISISDTGIGIPKDEIRYIFTKFYRAKNGRKTDTEGMGIGLYLSQKIIERHKGKMSVQSAGENLGTTFTIVLPMLD